MNQPASIKKKSHLSDLLAKKYGIKLANVYAIRDILEIAEAYDAIYTLENIENITVDSWITVIINGKTFQLKYFSTVSGGSYRFRVDGETKRRDQVAEFLAGGFDPKAERFKHYRKLYFAIRDKDSTAFEMYKEAVDGIDWSYMMSDDPRAYSNGKWQQKALIELAHLLGEEAVNYYRESNIKYWKRTSTTD